MVNDDGFDGMDGMDGTCERIQYMYVWMNFDRLHPF